MARTIAYPSRQFPAPPAIAVSMPDEWEPLVVPGVQMAIAQPRREGRFRANIVITIQRFAAGFTLEDAKKGLEQRKQALPQLEELGTGEIEADGIVWAASEYGYTQPGRPTVVQAARYAVIPREDVAVDVVEVVGSCGAEDAEAEIELLREIQDSVVIECD